MENMPFDSPLLDAYQLTVEDLDYKVIEESNDVSFLVKILRILRSSQCGHYPHLIEFAESRIRQLDPNHVILTKQENVWTKRDLPLPIKTDMQNELNKFCHSIHELEEQFSLLSIDDSPMNNYPVRDGEKCRAKQKKPAEAKLDKTEQISREPPEIRTHTKRIKSSDYAEWDKYDVNAECAKFDQLAQKGFDNKGHILRTATVLEIPETIENDGKSEEELTLIATREKAKGNEAYKSGDFQEAVSYFSRSISAVYSSIVINNRAQAYFKLKKYELAKQDCEAVLQMDPDNVKAHLRKGSISLELKEYQDAEKHFNRALHLSPGSVVARTGLRKVSENIQKPEVQTIPFIPNKKQRGPLIEVIE